MRDAPGAHRAFCKRFLSLRAWCYPPKRDSREPRFVAFLPYNVCPTYLMLSPSLSGVDSV